VEGVVIQIFILSLCHPVPLTCNLQHETCTSDNCIVQSAYSPGNAHRPGAGSPFLYSLIPWTFIPSRQILYERSGQKKLANPGVALTGKVGWYFNQHWGAEMHFGEQLYPVDEQGMVADYSG
jgi:hypothetical protein